MHGATKVSSIKIHIRNEIQILKASRMAKKARHIEKKDEQSQWAGETAHSGRFLLGHKSDPVSGCAMVGREKG